MQPYEAIAHRLRVPMRACIVGHAAMTVARGGGDGGSDRGMGILFEPVRRYRDGVLPAMFSRQIGDSVAGNRTANIGDVNGGE